VFTAQSSLAVGREFYADVKSRAEKVGRSRDHLKILPGCFVVVGDTVEEARAKRAKLDSLAAKRRVRCVRCSGCLPSPSPPSKKSAARQYQAGKASAGGWERNRCYYGIDGHIVEIDTAVKSTCEIVDCQFSQRRVCDEGLGEESVVREGIGVGMRNGVAEKRIVQTVYHRDGR